MGTLGNHTIRLPDGADQTLLDTGTGVSCVVTHSTLGEDEMTIEAPASLNAADLCPPWGQVQLFDPGGTRRFLGYCVGLQRTGTGTTERHILKFRGPNCVLEGITYRQAAQFAPPGAGFAANTNTVYVSRIILNRNPLTGGSINMPAQIADCLEWANSRLGIFNRIGYDIGGLSGITPPEDEESDRGVLDIVLTQLRWAPENTCRWDYTTVNPTLRFFHPLNFGEVIRVVDPAGNENFSANPRPDLLVNSVTIFYIYEESVTNAQTGQTKTWLLVNEDQSLVANGSFRDICATIALRPPVYNGIAFLGGEPIPVGLADALHGPYARPQMEMSWTTVADEVDWLHNPGEVWNAPPGVGAGAFQYAMSVCQSITRDLGRGRVTYHAGPPAHLGINDMLAILRAAWLRRQPRSAGEQQYGFKPPENADANTSGTKVKIAAAKQDPGGNTFTRGILSVPEDWFE